MDLLYKLLFLCPTLLIAGIIDGIAGGGGIIALPAYLIAGLPLDAAYGCNKMQSCIGTSASVFRYAKSGYLDIRTALVCAVSAIIGSHISTSILLLLSDSAVKIIIACAMCLIITLTLLTGKLRSGDTLRISLNLKNSLLCLGVGLLLGLYDGFFGPGGGTVALMLLTLIFRYDMRIANGNGKVLIVISNLIALCSHLAHGNVIFQIAIPATICNVIGSYIGASLSVKKGSKIVKPFLIAVAVILVIQAALKIL